VRVTQQIAFLRGVNLGPSRRVDMGELRRVLSSAGHEDIRTHLQSGNVVLTSPVPADRLQRDLERQIAGGLGLDVQVIVRTRDEMADVIARDPLGDVAHNPARYLVYFLSAEPDSDVVRELGSLDVTPEQFVVSGREIYAWHPEGVHRSRLSKPFSERRLGVRATARNWNTVVRLLAMADE
jgi:uncharacterized protein (DUF1697 family)